MANYQHEIYADGVAGKCPELPIEPGRLETAACERMEPAVRGYVVGAAGTESTARANRAAFERWRIVPRFLRDVSSRDLATTVLGTPMPAPVALAPIGVQGIMHPDGELATARAAAALGVPMTLSTVSSYSIEDVARESGAGPRWFQLYRPKDRDVGASLLARAKAAGFGALVLTLDTFMLAWRPRDLATGYLPFPHRDGLANYESDPAFRAGLTADPDDDPVAAFLHWQGMFGDASNSWDDIGWIRQHWDGPLALKGVLHPDDARRAVDEGADAVIVSNHGGRQVDGAVAALDALIEVRDALPQGVVLMDGGIRCAADIVKALALGADAVLLGRPYVYALAVGGQRGVEELIQNLTAELDLTLALAGATSVRDLDRSWLTSASS
jgi:lactate 2-monooxygenase